MNEDKIYLNHQVKYKKEGKTYIARLYSKVGCLGCCFIDKNNPYCDAYKYDIYNGNFNVCLCHAFSGYVSNTCQ